MTFKINIGTKEGKTWKLEADAPGLIGKSLNETIKGMDISSDLEGYEFEIKGTSDKSGFTSLDNIEGSGTKRTLLGYGKGMKKRHKLEGKKKRSTMKPKGLRMRKMVRGKVISDDVSQINLKLMKEGNKKLPEIFPDQAPQTEQPTEETNSEEKKE